MESQHKRRKADATEESQRYRGKTILQRKVSATDELLNLPKNKFE
jgi:hypothetical protein